MPDGRLGGIRYTRSQTGERETEARPRRTGMCVQRPEGGRGNGTVAEAVAPSEEETLSVPEIKISAQTLPAWFCFNPLTRSTSLVTLNWYRLVWGANHDVA